MPDDPKYQQGEAPTPADVPADVIISPDTRRANRLPPRQARTRKWPVLHATHAPVVDRDRWSLEVTGLVGHPLRLDWSSFRQLPRVRVLADFHCVTRWSRLGNLWEGVALCELLSRITPLPEARFVVVTGLDGGWTTNLPLENALAEDVLLADTHDGAPLDADHGGPVRLVVPQLYAWKSAKWVCRIELTTADQPGYWERAGYHNQGDPWTESRFGPGGDPRGF